MVVKGPEDVAELLAENLDMYAFEEEADRDDKDALFNEIKKCFGIQYTGNQTGVEAQYELLEIAFKDCLSDGTSPTDLTQEQLERTANLLAEDSFHEYVNILAQDTTRYTYSEITEYLEDDEEPVFHVENDLVEAYWEDTVQTRVEDYKTVV